MDFASELDSKMKKIGINLTQNQINQFYKYEKLLLEWNEKINLTRITDEQEIILKHFVDSLTIQKYIKENTKIVDIGTGAGFPGIPLKIVNPDNEIALIDSLNKRIVFLNEIIEKCELKNISAIHARAEEIGHNKQYREQYDIVTSRAVAKLNVLLEYMMPLVKVGGKCICMKGPNIKEELTEAENAIKILGGQIEAVEEITLPDTDNERTIIVIKSVKPSPNKYPRKPGTPTNSPL